MMLTALLVLALVFVIALPLRLLVARWRGRR